MRIGSFVNEEAPALFLPVEGDFSEADRIEVFIESFSDDAFILNTVLIDSEGKRYCAGYGVAEENRKSKISVAVCRLTQNRLNSEADALLASTPKKMPLFRPGSVSAAFRGSN